MDIHNNEQTRLWKVYRTVHQMVHDRVSADTHVDLICSD
jgi:hypothetical protein